MYTSVLLLQYMYMKSLDIKHDTVQYIL